MPSGGRWCCEFAENMAGCYARLADIEHAKASAAECLAMKPDFSVRQFMAKQLFKNPADAEDLAESLRMAGEPARYSFAGAPDRRQELRPCT
jgi:hypothetical protein